MVRVLVTGASGFVGAALSRWLTKLGHEVIAVTRTGSDLWRIGDILTPHIADLSTRGSFRTLVHQFAPDVIFHSAMYAGHPAVEEDRWACLRDSVQATQGVLEAALTCRTPRVIFIGSSTVYRQSREPLSETHPIDPATSRGAAKAASSIWFRQFVRQHGMSGLELRLFSVYGPWESPSRFIPVLLRAAQTGTPVSLKPGPRHDFVHIDDVCRACEIALHASVEPGDIFNIGTGVEHANEEVVAMVERVTGRPIAIARQPHFGHPPDTEHWRADITKARNLLRWAPQHTLSTGLAATAQWLAEREGALCLV